MPHNVRERYHTITPQTVVDDAHATLDFVKKVLGAEVTELYEDGERVMHAEALIGNSKVFIAEADDEFGAFPFMVNVYVDDVDAVHARALEHGATNLREPEDQFYGDRTGGVLDTQGNHWWLSTHVEDVSEEEIRRRISMNG